MQPTVVTIICESGHSQTIKVEGMSREWAEQWAGLIDGTSTFYVHSPIGTESVIGKCGICGKQIKATVESDSTVEQR